METVSGKLQLDRTARLQQQGWTFVRLFSKQHGDGVGKTARLVWVILYYLCYHEKILF
jgi:hypothetical protein